MDGVGVYQRLLRDRQLVRLYTGEFVSSIGDWLYSVALLVLVYQSTQDPLVLGLVFAARMLPMLILSVPAGIVADRFDRRMVLLTTDLARGALMIVMGVLVATDAPIAYTVCLALVAASFATFFGPALGAYLPTVVGDERNLGPANSVWATLDNLAFFIGPAIAGLLIAVGGVQVGFLINALTFGFVALVMWTLPPGRPNRAASGPASEVAAKPRTGASMRSLLALIKGPILVDAATGFAGAGMSVLIVILAVEQLDGGPAAVGYLNAATGIGGVVAGFIAGILLLRRLDVPLIVGSVVAGIGFVALGLTTTLLAALLVIAVAVGALMLLDVVVTTLVQRMVVDELRGRAMGVMQLTGFASAIVGAVVLPAATMYLSLAAVLGAMGIVVAVMTLAAVVILRRQGALRASTIDPGRVELLRRTLFAGLPPARLEAAARDLVPLTVTAGVAVVRQGETPDRFYIIESGHFSVRQTDGAGVETELRQLGPGEVFGEIGLLTGAPRSATVTSTTAAELFALDRASFLTLAGAGPDLTSRLLDLYRGTLPA